MAERYKLPIDDIKKAKIEPNVGNHVTISVEGKGFLDTEISIVKDDFVIVESKEEESDHTLH